jgi:hypothetical protein
MTEVRKATQAEHEATLAWLQRQLVADARGDGLVQIGNHPASIFWLGRLTPEVDIINAPDDRLERLAPCAIGMRLRPRGSGPWTLRLAVSVCFWDKADKSPQWSKQGPIEFEVSIAIDEASPRKRTSENEFRRALGTPSGRTDLCAAFDVSTEQRDGRLELVIELVNTSFSNERSPQDRNLYETKFSVVGFEADCFHLDGLPDVFRYDRVLPAIGLNCAVVATGDRISTSDVPEVSRPRPIFTPPGIDERLLRFDVLSKDPIASAGALVEAHGRWGGVFWSERRLEERARSEGWSTDMIAAANDGREAFLLENERLQQGLALLRSNESLRRAFCLMNDAMIISSRGKYSGWRAFQLGFLLANFRSLVDVGDTEIADIVWFATGGGKTETYLGLLITAILLDRLNGKLAGITAWSRFPLRMLSLQQTQRFADALAAAELIRRDHGIGGDTFSLGFFVGQGATPNRLSVDPQEGEPNPYDEDGLQQYLVLDRCPFCRTEGVRLEFDPTTWALRHRCQSKDCPWKEPGLPFYVVDEEIYRFLPTVVVGTLDKAASISMQAAMRGFVGSPLGRCTKLGHGYTYAPRSNKPSGCLVPNCAHKVEPIGEEEARKFAPTLRLQDELHLLRDSLGAVDAHYEALFDNLSLYLAGRKAKILASSATLSGYERQVDVLYARRSRVFPQPGPEHGVGFWSSDSPDLMRHYVALAPRGVTVEHAVDRLLTVLQRSIRRLVTDPVGACAEIGVSPDIAEELIDLFGTNVVYGNTLRDLDAMSRSAETQILVDGVVHQRSLTGRSGFEDVRRTLKDLESPAQTFQDRIHVVLASSMMSHGVDIDRLNIMVMVGFPLGTAEFIQSTARVGRRFPGLVIVVPKMGRERDAAIYRTFPKFVEHADRLVEPIPITRRSRRVLHRTLPGIELARILMVSEPLSGKALTMPRSLKKYWQDSGFDPDAEAARIVEALGLHDALDEGMRRDIAAWMDVFVRNVNDPPADTRFTSQACPGAGPMRSLRDVEETVPIFGKEDDQ